MAGSERSGFRRGALLVAALLAAMSASNCGEFARTNPFDPAVPVTVTVTGPDSAFGQFDTLHFAFTTDPAYDHGLVEWQLSGLQKLDNNGAYRVGPIENYSGKPVTVTVKVTVDSRTGSKLVSVVFPPAGLRVRTCQTNAREVTFASLTQWVDLCVSVVDVRGGVISMNAENPPATARVIDPTVASTGFRRVTAVGNGTTAVVYNFGALADTFTVTVKQVVASLTVSPTRCTGSSADPPVVMNVGDTLRLALSAPAYDLWSQPVTDPATIQRAIQDARWGLVTPSGAISVTPDGLVKALAPGFVRVEARFPTLPNYPYAASCNISVF